jgi:hypothetical protein
MNRENDKYWYDLRDEIKKVYGYIDNNFTGRLLVDIKKLLKYHTAIDADSASAECEEVTTFLKKKGLASLGSSFETHDRTAACFRNSKGELVFVALFCVFSVGNYLFGLATNIVAKKNHLNDCTKKFYHDMAQALTIKANALNQKVERKYVYRGSFLAAHAL